MVIDDRDASERGFVGGVGANTDHFAVDGNVFAGWDNGIQTRVRGIRGVMEREGGGSAVGLLEGGAWNVIFGSPGGEGVDLGWFRDYDAH